VKNHYDEGVLLAMTRNNASYWYGFEGIGTTRQLMGSQGQVVDAYAFDAWGNEITNPQSQVPNPFKYVGKHGYYWDTESALMLLGVRYYSNGLGRFMSSDPLKDKMNWFLYADSKPLIMIDPTGQFSWEDIWDIICDVWQLIKKCLKCKPKPKHSSCEKTKNPLICEFCMSVICALPQPNPCAFCDKFPLPLGVICNQICKKPGNPLTCQHWCVEYANWKSGPDWSICMITRTTKDCEECCEKVCGQNLPCKKPCRGYCTRHGSGPGSGADDEWVWIKKGRW
jgi:RHS repeat-associated protein